MPERIELIQECLRRTRVNQHLPVEVTAARSERLRSTDGEVRDAVAIDIAQRRDCCAEERFLGSAIDAEQRLRRDARQARGHEYAERGDEIGDPAHRYGAGQV